MAEGTKYDDKVDMVDNKTTERHETSEKLIDPYCEPCLETVKTLINAICYCPECNVFFCKSCHEFHKKLPASENHRVLRGSKMPKSHTDKPVVYPDCNIHAGKVNDRYCFQHHGMVCSECIKQDHQSCDAVTISVACKDIGPEDINQFKTVIYMIKQTVNSTQSDLQKYASDLEEQKQAMIEKAKQERDKIVSQAGEMFENTVSNITTFCQKKNSEIDKQVLTLIDEIHALDEIIDNLDKFSESNFDENMFIRMQKVVKNTQECKTDIDVVISQLYKTELLFESSKNVLSFLNGGKTLGDITEELIQIDYKKGTEDIVFPNLSPVMKMAKPDETSADISQIAVTKLPRLNIRTPNDTEKCKVSGMAVTDNGTILISDFQNASLKIFLQNKWLSSVTLSDFCYHITVMKDNMAILGTFDKKLHFIDISDPSSALIQRTIYLNYWVVGLVTYNENLIVTAYDKLKSVKMIDMNGEELWSVSTGPDDQQLFVNPYAVVMNKMNGIETVIVSDWATEALTVLDVNNGTLLKTIDMKGKAPHGLTVDNKGNTFVCCCKTREICIWSNDFANSMNLNAELEFGHNPADILYNLATGELFVACYQNDEIDRFGVNKNN